MQIILKPINHRRYTEAPQTNPIRFVAMHQIGENEYTNSTNVFKCKDYFNDFVAHKHKHSSFEAYGMLSNAVTFDQYGGLYVLVFNITNNFRKNLERVLEPFQRKWGARVTYEPVTAAAFTDPKHMLLPAQQANAAMLWFSPECFVSTFRISALTLFIRNCNIDVEIKSYQDACWLPRVVLEAQWYPNQYELFLKEEIDFPQQQEYWYYMGTSYNSKGSPETDGYTLHNNGQSSWLSYLVPGRLLSYKSMMAFHSSLGITDESEDDGEELDFDEDEEETNETT